MDLAIMRQIFSSLANEVNISNVLWIFPQGPKNYPMGFDGAQWFPLLVIPPQKEGNRKN